MDINIIVLTFVNPGQEQFASTQLCISLAYVERKKRLFQWQTQNYCSSVFACSHQKVLNKVIDFISIVLTLHPSEAAHWALYDSAVVWSGSSLFTEVCNRSHTASSILPYTPANPPNFPMESTSNPPLWLSHLGTNCRLWQTTHSRWNLLRRSRMPTGSTGFPEEPIQPSPSRNPFHQDT